MPPSASQAHPGCWHGWLHELSTEFEIWFRVVVLPAVRHRGMLPGQRLLGGQQEGRREFRREMGQTRGVGRQDEVGLAVAAAAYVPAAAAAVAAVPVAAAPAADGADREWEDGHDYGSEYRWWKIPGPEEASGALMRPASAEWARARQSWFESDSGQFVVGVPVAWELLGAASG
jgi:hypothetical protein